MTYGYYSNKRGRKQSRSKTKQLELRRILASLTMAAGILAYPFGIGEAAIVDKGGNTISPEGKVYNIDPEKVNGDFAYKRYQQFALEAGYIANLKFGNATTLANLVQNKITIDGIVNAVRNNQIDGHLIFLSPNGIAVGSTGVINAGQFTGIVPREDAFNKLYNETSKPDDVITLAAINKIKDDGAYAAVKTDAESGTTGTIDISGKINTHSGVMLGAGIININDGARIQSTKDLNFTNLVNIKNENGDVTTDSGLTGLTASAGTDGDIIIAARQVSVVKDTKTVQGENNQTTTEANAIRWKDRSTDLNAAVNIGKDATTKGVEITSSDGVVKITAESTSTYEDSTPMTLTDTLKTAIFGNEQTVIDGLVDKLAKKEAGANKYLFVNYSNKKSKASVNVGANSAITGNSIDIEAKSTVDIKQSVASGAAGKTDSNGNTVQGDSKVVAAVAISRVNNNADIVIDGNLTANGADTDGSGIKIAANADTKVSLSAAGNGGDANAVAVGVAVLTGDTKAKVTVKEGATALSATQGKVSVDATTQNDVGVKVNVVGTQSYVSSNVGVANYDTSADVIINRSITAGAVDINAENKFTGLKLTVDNTANTSAPAKDTEERNDTEDENAANSQGDVTGEKKSIDPTKLINTASVDTSNTQSGTTQDTQNQDSTDDQDETGAQDTQTQDAAGAIQRVQDRVAGTNAGGNNTQQTSAFGLGASVGVFSNKNDANVKIGENVVITAAPVESGPNGSVNVLAKSLVTASTEHEDTLQFTVKNTLTNAKAEIGAAVLVSNVKNNATVLLDTDGTHSAQISGGAVALDAKAGMGKYPAPPEQDGGTTGTGTGTGTGTESGGNGNTGNNNGNEESEPEEKTSVLTYMVSAEGTSEEQTPSTFALSGSVGVNTLKNNAIVLLGQNSQVTGSAVTLSSDAATGAEGTYGAEESNTKVGIGASVGIQNIRGNSLVMAGKGVQLTGSESLTASASNEMEVKNTAQNAGKSGSVGVSGMVALSYGDSNSIVALDDETNIQTGLATVTSTNSTNIENSARTEANGNAGAKAFGLGAGIVNYDINSIAMVADNGSGISVPSEGTTDEAKAAKKIYEDAKLARDVAGSTFAGKLGAATTAGTKGSITTGGLVGAAVTTGMIQNDAKANANVAPKEEGSGSEGNANENQADNWTQWTNQGREGANEARTNTNNLEQDTVTSQNESGAPNASGAAGEASRAANPDATSSSDPADITPANAGASIGIEGSAALTFLGGRTDAILDNVTVKSGTEAEPAPVAAVSLSATDFLGSITIGGTGVKNKLEEGSSSTTVGIGGTFAMNSSKRDVDSLIRNAVLPMALMVSNSATKIGIEVAAGMGASSSNSGGTSVAGAGVVYYNKAKQDVHALLINNNVMGASVSNKATSTDFQIAGGLSGNAAKVGVGGAVAISNLENNLSSGIIGGNYTVLSSVDVEAQKGTTQINGALAGTKGSYGFEGAFAYGSVKNTTRAYISGVSGENKGIQAGAVNVKAGEIPVTKTDTQISEEKTKIDGKIDSSVDSNPNNIDKNKNYTQLDSGTKTKAKTQLKNQANAALDKEKETQTKNKTTLENTGIDTTGASYLDKSSNVTSSLGDDASNTDASAAAGDAAGDENEAKDELGKNRSITITAAMGGGWNGEAGAGAGIAYNYVKNDIAADIKDSNITAGTVNGEAATDSLIVSVGAGVAVGGKAFNGAGSGSWNDLKNDTRVTFENNDITGKNISEQAHNTSSIINIAGEVAGGKGMALGLSLAYNSLNNTTGTYLKGNTVTLQDENKATAIRLATMNQSKALAVAGGVDVNISQELLGAVGTVAINRGVNNTESVIDGKTTGNTVTNTTLNNVKDLSVKATDVTKKTTVAGGVSVGGKKVGVGGAVAYTSIGSSSKKEKLLAEINHADITTIGAGTIEVSAADSLKNANNELVKSRITSVGAGVGVSWGKNWFNLQGAAAVSDIYKTNRASLNNTNITASIDSNTNNATNQPAAVTVTADTKSKINSVGAVANISVKSVVTAAVGIAINRMNQDTVAEMNTDDGNTTTSNVGLTQVRATGDADIHSVGVGTTVSVLERAAAAGSGSYNYIGNNVDAIIKNQNLTSNSSVGVVARSDDRLYNFAGGFSIGAATNVALGTAVSTNKISGNTNALVSGGSLAAADTGAITVTRPQDTNLFTINNIDLTTDRERLSANRQESTKTGIVVDSSATHTLISQLSSGGVGANSSFAVNLDGTVNINTIEGKTTAKIQDANLNSEGKASNINVNAVDYTNIGSFTGTPAIAAAAAAGVSIGVSANWETFDRKTEAEISSSSVNAKKNVYAKNLTVDAIAKHGSSSLAFAASAGGGKVGITSGDGIMRHKNSSTTSAQLKNVNAVFDGTAEIKAEHLGNSFSQNIAAGLAAGMVAVAAGAGVSVMDDTSTVTAEVTDSVLKETAKATSDTDKKTISVLAKNENHWKNTLVTANLAVGIGAGLAANVGIHNTTGQTAAVVSNSHLEVTDVTVKATDKLTAHATGGVGAGGIGGVGVAVTLNNINSSVSAHVDGGSVKASNNIEVTAEAERDFDSQVTGAAAGGIGVGVNVAVTSINKGITDAQLSNAKDENGNPMGSKDGKNVDETTKENINKHLNSVNGAKGALDLSQATFYGLNADGKADLNAAKNASISLSTPTYSAETPDTKKLGVHTKISGGASLTAEGNVNVTAKDTSDINEKNVGVTAAGAASVNVTDAIIHTNYDTDVTLNSATVTGKNVNINALQTQKGDGSKVGVTAVTVGALGGVGVGYAGIVNRGSTDVNITGSTIGVTKGSGDVPDTVSAENVTINATDESKHRSDILSVGVAALNVTTTFASVENYSNVGITLNDTTDSENNIISTNISSAKDVTIDAKKANTLEAHTQGVGVGGVNVAVNHATIEDGEKDKNGNIVKGNATAKITGTNGKFSANSFHLGATNDTTAKLSAGNVAVSVLGVSRMRGKGVMAMGADVNVAGGTFNAKTVEFVSLLGNADRERRTLEGNVKGHNISAVAVAPDAVILNTDATGTVNVANSTFGENTTLILSNTSFVDRKAYIYDVTAGAVAVGNTSADIVGNETLTTSLTGKDGTTHKLNSLQVAAYGENTGKALADAGGGGLVGYVGAHVDNKSTNNVTSTLSGKWDLTGEAYLVAAQMDETRLTAKEGHGGVIGVGGTSVDNTIRTTTSATVANETVITADRVHVGTANSLTTGAYDDKDGNGKTDAQTYTLQDHFGGAISGNRLRSLLDVTENGTVTIGENSKITTNNLQEYVATSQNDLTNHASAKGGGAVAVTDTVTENKLTINNTVDVKSGAVLSNEKEASTEDIILAAYDEHKLNSHADATVGGAVGVLVGKNETTMNRKSNVNVAGTIESGNSVGLYAGANEDGVLSNLNVDLKAGVYNYTAIPVSSPTVNYNSVADRGAVDVSGTVRSTKDINAIASGGKENVVTDESKWAWVNGGKEINKKFLSSDAVVAEEAMPKTSTVNVTGSLIAGTADPINVTITGSVAGGLTVVIPDELAESKANLRVKNGIKEGTFDYANTLGARLTELNGLIASYNGQNAEVMAAYIAERDRIRQKMTDLGIGAQDTNGRPVYYVEIPDIATSGGNINVQTNDFTGTGALRANSAPSVTITNASDAYLKLNNIIMGGKGGQIIYNQDNVIPPGVPEGNNKINEVNLRNSGASFSEIYGVTNDQAAKLEVKNTKTFSGDKTSTISLTPKLENEIDNSNLTEAEKEEGKQWIRDGKLTYTAITDVEVNGKISNFYGNVTINNASGDIHISGGTTGRPTGVEGNTVTLIASGTIAQDYKEGIVNINGDPEKYLETTATFMKNNLGLSTTDTDTKTATSNTPARDGAQTATGYIAGRDIYVSASNINVNGLIQSGYKNYIAEVTQSDLDAAKTRPAGKAAVVQNRTMYKVNEGGAKWNDTDKVFDYVPQVYWDPSTDKLVVEDIDTAGGKVYLTGKIASTGTGMYNSDNEPIPARILAADGAAIISVENKTSLDMNMGNVLNNQREGIITIADTAKNTWTEYKKGQTRTITGYSAYLADLKNKLKDHPEWTDPYDGAQKSDNNLSTTNTVSYTVKDRQTYSWVTGISVETTRTFEHYVRKGLWGAIETVNEEGLKALSNTSRPIDSVEGKRLGLPEGAVITESSNSLNIGQLKLDGNTRVLSSEIKDRTHEEWRSGFLGWFKHTRDRWKVGTKTIQLYNYTMNASQPINIGLIGADVGKIDIKSTNASGGSINLTGNVANSHNQAELNISSAAGGIKQFDNTTLKSEIVNLTAKDDIKNIHIASIGTVTERDADGKATAVQDNIKLSAVSTGKGDIDITAVGGVLENQSLPGNVEIVALKSRSRDETQVNPYVFDKNVDLGDVTLNAAGNITQSGNGVTVEGRGINLTSKNGGIGTSGQAINIAGSDLVYSTDRYGAQVNASAKDSIYLTEVDAGGDMRVGKIESKAGDVTLTVTNGGFIDGLPGNDKSGSLDSVDEMVHRWIDAGLIDGEKDAQGNYTYKGAYIEGLKKARNDYRANVVSAYDIETVYASEDYQNYKARTGAYANMTDEQITAKLEEDGHQKYADYAQYETAAEYRTAHQIDWATRYNTEKSVVEAVYASADYQAYVAGTGVYAGMTAEQKSANLVADGHQNYVTYAKYATADAYLKDTAAYKYSQYANADDYLEHDATYKDLDAKANNPTFEWTKDMMLYAVSDALVNKASGESAQTKRAANVLGNNVTLKSTKGAVGTVEDTATVITVEQLDGNDRIQYMKQLMNVDASDVEVKRDSDGNLLSFEIKRNLPLGVFLKEKSSLEDGTLKKGALNVQAGGDVSVAGRTDKAGEHSAINVGTVNSTNNNATGDVRLYSAKGIYNALDANQTNITGKNLLLVGGEEKVSVDGDERASIGTSDKPLTVSLTGALTEARSSENIYIKNMKQDAVLKLGAMYAGDTISLESKMGFLMREYKPNEDIAESYINAGKNLVFTADATNGVVGDADHAIRILNDRAPVNITAGSAYIRGMGSISQGVQNGTMLLGTINTTGEFVANSDGSLAVGREADSAGNTAVTGSVNAGGNVTLAATDKLTLDGTVTAVDKNNNVMKELTLKAVNGNITQTDKGAITADTVKTFNGKSLLLENAYKYNQFNSITVDGIETETGKAIDGNVRIKDNSDALTVAVKRDVTGDISVENRKTGGTLTNSGNLTATGNIGLKADGNLTQAAGTTLNAGKDVNLTSTNGSITQNVTEGTTTGIQAQKVTTVSAKKVDLQGTGNQFDVLTAQSSGANAPIQGGVLIKDSTDKLALSIQPSVIGPITVENTKDNGAIQVTSELQAKTQGTDTGTLTLKSDGSMQIDKNVTADSDVVLTSVSGAMTIGGDVSASNNITLTSKETMQTTGKLTAVNNVTATSTNGAMTIGGDVTTTTGDIKLQSNGNMQTTGKLTAKQNANSDNPAGNVNLTSTAGNVTVGGDVTTGTTSPELVDSDKDGIPELKGIYNSLTIHAGGAIQETDGVKIDTPVVETYSGKGVSLESAKNTFGIFLADGVDNSKEIDGSVKVATNYYKGEDDSVVTIGLGASVLGDAEFSNLNPNGGLGILVWHPDDKNRNISILGGNGADGNLVLKASQDVGLLGDAYAAHDVVVKSTNGSFYGIGRSITAENDVNVSVADSVYYIGGTGKALSARHDIIFEATNPASKDAGIYIGALPDNINLMDVMNGTASVEEAPTKLWAGNNANFNVNGNGDIDLEGDVIAEAGKVSATVAGKGDITVGNEEGVAETTIMAQKDVTLKTEEGNIKVTKGIQSTEESVSVQTGKGDITVGRDKVVDGKTITAKKDVSVGTDLGTIYIQGETSTVNGDITMRAGKDTYEVESDNVNFVIRDDGKVSSGGGVTLKGRNGDIHITNDISAKKGLTASITEQGNVYFDTDVDVTENVDISTDKGNINVGHTVNAKTGTVSLQTGTGDISIGADVTAGSDVTMHVNNGDVTVGDGVTGDDAGSSGQGNVVAKNGDVTVDISGKGNVGITKSVDSQNGSVSVKTKDGDINIGSANVKDDKTVTAKENVNVETDLGTIYILGMTSTEKGDITMKAGKDTYLPDTGSDENLVQNGNFIIKDDGKLNAGGAVNLKGRNGDIHITDAIEAQKGITTSITEKGNVYFEKDVTVKDDVNITTEDGNIAIGKTVTSTEGNVNLQTGTGSILIGEDVTAEKDVTITTKEGSVIVGDTDTGGDGDVLSKKGDVSIQTGEGVVGIVKSVKAQEGSIDIQVGTGGVTIGNNGPKEKTVTAYKNIDVAVELGRIEIYGKTSTQTGDISMSAAESTYVPGGQNIIIAQYGELDSGRDARLTGRNGDLHVTDAVKAVRNLNATVLDEGDISLDRDVNVIGNTTVTINGKGSVFGHNIVSGGTTHVSLTKGDLFLNLAEGKAVVLRMEDNTKASKVGTVLADASGGAGLDVELTGNFIQIGTIEAKGGNSVLQLSAMGAGNQKLISGEISVGSLRSANGTHMPSLWANRGNVHVDEGNLAIDDVLAEDKIHLENNLTDLAIFGRTPTRDGEQLYYWNNLGRAYSKTRPFNLYTDGKVRTHRAVLIDAGRYYDKLYGDNLSVVDMMRERLTNEHGQYTFDRTWFTKPGEALREKVLFGLDAVDTDIRKHNASNGELL